MRDCDNVSVRDRLPELLHRRLSEADRASVQAHLDGCAECAAEWRVLRASRDAIEAIGPRVNVDAIAAAVAARLAADRRPALHVVRGDAPAPAVRPAPVAAPTGRRTWSSVPLRAAAAVVVMALGAGVVVSRRPDAAPPVSSTTPAVVPGPVAIAPTPGVAPESSVVSPRVTPATHPSTSPASPASAASALGSTFSDLSDEELAAVIRAVESDAGLPAADSSATPVIVTSGDML